MLRNTFLAVTLSFVTLGAAALSVPAIGAAQEKAAPAESNDRHSALHKILFYLPNRVFDVLDIFRLRVRVGPGLAVGVRATELADIYLGSYATVFAGLPGPREEASLPIPVGLESHNGAEISLLDATVDAGMGPGYTDSEFGVSFQAAVVGADVGFDPIEILDFICGIFTFDIRNDDF